MKALFSCFLLLAQLVVYGQSSQFRVISCTGDVTHKMASSEDRKIVPGASIKPQGSLILGDNSSIKIICSDKPQVLSEAGEYDLSQLYDDGTSKSMSFTGKFWNFIMDGLKKSDSEDDLLEYHKEYMSVTGGVKGYSPAESALNFISPLSGNLESSIVELKWNDPKNSGIYNITVRVEEGDKQVLTVNLKRPVYTIDLSKYGVSEGQQVFLSVSHELAYQNELSLIYKPINQKKIDRKLSSLIDYEKGSDKEKAWMQATIYEMEGYNTKASNMYEDLVKLYPEDGYIQKLNHLFLVRTNQMKKLSLSADN